MPNMTRDQFLKLVAAGTAAYFGLNPLARAQESASRGPVVPWGRLKFVGEQGEDHDWSVHPQGDLNLIDAIRKDTSLNLEKKWNIADIADLSSMVSYPFLFMHAEIAPQLDDKARQNLREYFMRGGFLFAEDCVHGYFHHGNNSLNDFFFRGMAEELMTILPGAKFEKVPSDHPVFHCLHHFTKIPHMQGTEHGLYSLTYNGRVVALLSPSDIHCGWTNGAAWWGPAAQQAAMQMGANIYLFAMTQTTNPAARV